MAISVPSIRFLIAGGIVLLLAVGAVAFIGARRSGAEPPLPRVPAPAAPISAPVEAAVPRSAGQFLGVLLARSSIDIASGHEGRLDAVNVRLGDAVVSGESLARLEIPTVRFDLAMAEASAKAARVELDRAEVELAQAEEHGARREKLAAEGLASTEDLTTSRYQVRLAGVRIASAQAQIREKQARVEQLRHLSAETEIRAPFAGIIAARYANPGANVTPSTPILRLISAGDLFVRFAVPDEARSLATVGASVRVIVGTAVVRGIVDKIAPEVDAASRLVVVEARLGPEDMPAGALLSGEIARVSFEDAGP